ncbi:hypothetical protein COO60DRAFT_1511685 [Scenedesmus sp. NREL 46B-D3]|nr:hypothetical protein COO60DRAFT_1511685 [Scenedesmus sp. NREL 46B-D3]
MKAAVFAVAACLLVGTAFATLGDNGMTTYTGRTRQSDTLVFGNQLVIDNAMAATFDLTEQMLTGTYTAHRNDPATEKKVVELECTNSIAPPPLNWHMWCPGKDAVVKGWTDKSGAAHRSITLRPQQNMTSTMATWFITTHVLGLMPPVVEFQGNKYYYYHLWHPIDHIEAAWSLGPALQGHAPLRDNGWFYVADSIMNLARNRYVITMPMLGLPTWTMIIEFNDTPEGMVVDIEVVAGIPSKGYDERNPSDGYLMAAGMNEMLTAPLLAKQKDSPDWENSINAITRHAIEEFSNLQFFFNGKSAQDMQTVSFYNALAALAAKQTNLSNTTYGQAVSTMMDNSAEVYRWKTNVAERAVEAKSQATYVPVSNAVTKAAYDANKANGAHPEQDITMQGMIKAVGDAVSSGAASTSSGAAAATSSSATSSSATSSDGDTTRITIRFGKGADSGSSSTASSGSGNWFRNMFNGRRRMFM